MRKPALVVSCLAVLAMLLGGCASAVYRPGASAGFSLDPAHEINDADIRAAFEARPQLRTPVRVAYLVFGDQGVEDIEKALKAIPQVTDVYRIPELLATGRRATLTPHRDSMHDSRFQPRQPLSMKKLRLIAARAHCDLLLVFDYGYVSESSPNGFVALNILLLPALFTPFLDVQVYSGVDAYLLDVRNGYLYAQITSRSEASSDYHTIYTAESKARALRDGQWDELLPRVSRDIAGILAGGKASGAAQSGAER